MALSPGPCWRPSGAWWCCRCRSRCRSRGWSRCCCCRSACASRSWPAIVKSWLGMILQRTNWYFFSEQQSAKQFLESEFNPCELSLRTSFNVPFHFGRDSPEMLAWGKKIPKTTGFSLLFFCHFLLGFLKVSLAFWNQWNVKWGKKQTTTRFTDTFEAKLALKIFRANKRYGGN